MGIERSRIIKLLELEAASEILVQTSPLTEKRQREHAQGHHLASSGSATGIQVFNTLIKFIPLLMPVH